MLSYHTDPMTNIQYTAFPDQLLSATMRHVEARPLLEANLMVNAKKVTGPIERSGWNIHLSNDASMAWVAFKATFTFGGQRIATEEIRGMEKVGGEWKLGLTGTLVNPGGGGKPEEVLILLTS